VATNWQGEEFGLLRSALEDLTELLVSEESLAIVLQRVVALACDGIGACDLASITYMRDGRPETVVTTDPVAEEIDDVQYGEGTGPCLEAFRTRSMVSVPSMTQGGRWVAFQEAALARGVHSSFSLPLAVGEARVGALNLYGRRDRAFDSTPSDAAVLFAKQAAAAVWSAQTIENAKALAGHLESALESRDTIGMAKGIIMVSEKVTADEAFKILTRASQHRNVKLRDVAAEVVDTGATPN
jgi:GAF domain-containing protein